MGFKWAEKSHIKGLRQVGRVAGQSNETDVILLAQGCHVQTHVEGNVVHNECTGPSVFLSRPGNHDFLYPAKIHKYKR